MNIDAIFDWAIYVSHEINRKHRIRELTQQVDSVRCGDCTKWMCSRLCPRERNIDGRNHGPSCNGEICDQFVEKDTYKKLREERRAELEALKR